MKESNCMTNFMNYIPNSTSVIFVSHDEILFSSDASHVWRASEEKKGIYIKNTPDYILHADIISIFLYSFDSIIYTVPFFLLYAIMLFTILFQFYSISYSLFSISCSLYFLFYSTYPIPFRFASFSCITFYWYSIQFSITNPLPCSNWT
jgi:hypothetical protein